MNYIHIGFPKNFSTSLQRTYFARHPDLYHLGVGTPDDNIGYVDKEVESAMELYLRTCKHFKYEENKSRLQKTFEKHFEIAAQKSLKAGVSAEHFSFSYSYDSISSYDKAIRLKEIFQGETKIIIFLRSQKAMIESLYKECIRTGIFVDFKKYIELFYKYQDRNYYYDLAYTNLIRTYHDLFGSENVKVFFFEDYKDRNGLVINSKGFPKLINDLNDFLQIRQVNTFEHHNKALDENQLVGMLDVNRVNRHNLGQHLLESPENHRIQTYLKYDLGMENEQKEAYRDVLVKRENIATASKMEAQGRLLMEWPRSLKEEIFNFYRKDNKILVDFLDHKIPSSFNF